MLTQWFIERPTRAERKAAAEQQRQLELQRQQYELSIRQQTLDDIARKAAALNAVYASRTPQSTTLEDASIRVPAPVGHHLTEHEEWPAQ